MNPDEIFNLPSMPPDNRTYPMGPYRFIDREYFIVIYESDSDAIRRAVPELLQPDGSHQVFYEWINMPDSSGFGSYQESGVVIPCTFEGEPVNYTAQMYLNDAPPISAGRGIWGFPKRWGQWRLTVETDTLTGTLEFKLPLLDRMHNAHDGNARVLTEEENLKTVMSSVQPDERQALASFLCLNSATSIDDTGLAVVSSRTAQ